MQISKTFIANKSIKGKKDAHKSFRSIYHVVEI